MYIQKAKIENIRSIVNFEIEFKNPAGWHVLIGDNGAGKSTIIRSMALALVGYIEAQGLREDFNDWLSKKRNNGARPSKLKGEINLNLFWNKNIDSLDSGNHEFNLGLLNTNPISVSINFEESVSQKFSQGRATEVGFEHTRFFIPSYAKSGFFSVAFGPYRRFEGGNSEWEELFNNPSFTKLSAHLSVFDESVALTEPIKWLKDLNYKALEKNEESQHTLENLKKLINSENFLPHNAQFESVSSDGVFFKDGNGTTISVNQMSDGYRSILSMTFELIRQLVRVYGSELVFKNIEKDEMFIDLPGVVLIDEIDAHLHPTWQTRIGNWFLKYFPQLQFIVTTHSPLVCRAAEKGSIWRLAAPGSDEKSGEVTGVDRERLVYGNILDAYGTEVFGEDVSISQRSVEKQEELVKLSKKKMLDAISPDEEEKLQDLKKVFTTDAPIEL